MSKLFAGNHDEFLDWSQGIYAEMVKANCYSQVVKEIPHPKASTHIEFGRQATVKVPPQEQGKLSRWSHLVSQYKKDHKDILFGSSRCSQDWEGCSQEHQDG